MLREADTAERLADLVSYEPDKRRLREQAKHLRRKAEDLRESRSWFSAHERQNGP
jgi:hypothetical protein